MANEENGRDNERRQPALIGLDHVALLVADVDRSAEWYRKVLGLTDAFPGQWDGVPRMMLESDKQPALGTGVALFPRNESPTTAATDTRFAHLAFRVADEEAFRLWRDRLTSLGIKYALQDHEVSHSMYFHDPDGVKLEITYYR